MANVSASNMGVLGIIKGTRGAAAEAKARRGQVEVLRGEKAKAAAHADNVVQLSGIEISYTNDILGNYTLNVANLPAGRERQVLNEIEAEARKLGLTITVPSPIAGQSASITGIRYATIEQLARLPLEVSLNAVLADMAIRLW